ncbi:hypothetical protein SCUCBS95973_003922 [Sporothrix curviconia]|uniref:C2H2-type domain-containing protein n=1 Tax=Sporothrix curviconia TaxID=1260050 RepID=A0ABP0BJI9_9PEZI
MSTVMEPKKFLSFLYDGDTYPLFGGSRPQSPAPSGRFGLRKSTSSSRSSSFSPDLLDTPSMSCVTRATSREDCATQRFIVWAAVRRNACGRMTEGERLECPLLRCTRRFQDHESMLRHLITCDRLEYCEYWCYDHMRIERFDDSRCKKCLGHPSKRRKMLSMAKSFFTSLGHNKGKAVVDGGGMGDGMGVGYSPAQSFVSAEASPISPESIGFGSDYLTRSGSNGSSSSSSGSSRYATSHRSNSNRSHDSSRHNSYRRSPTGLDISGPTSSSASPMLGNGYHPPPRYEDINSRMQAHAELPSTEIVEIDSRELTELPKQSTSTVMPVTRYKPSAANMMTRPDFINDITLSTPAFQDITSIAPIVTPTPPPPPPACPTPPPASVHVVSPIASHASIDPMDLFLPSELDSTAIGNTSFMDWDPTASAGLALSGTLGGVDATGASFPSFMDFESSDSMFYAVPNDANQMAPPVNNRLQRPSSTTPAPRSKNLSPSSSVRSTASTTSTTSTTSIMSGVSDTSFMSNATSIISPVSDCSQGTNPWSVPALMSTSTDVQTTSASPADDDFSSFFNNDFFAAPEPDVSDALCKPDACFVPDITTDLADALDNLPPEALLFNFDAPIVVDSDPMLQNFTPPPAAASGLPSMPVFDDLAVDNNSIKNSVATHNGNDDDDSDPLFPDAQNMAASAQDLLLTHVMTSLAKLRDIDCSKNTLALLFQNASPRLIMDTGIQSLQTALATGNETMTPFDTLCFIHLIYAFSLVTYETEAALRTSALFAQSLEYSRHFGSLDRENYLEIVSVIWQPGNMTTAELSECLRLCRNNSASNPMPLYSGNVVGNTARAFLDDLEMSAVLVPVSTPSRLVRSSSIYQRHYSSSNDNSLRSSLVFSAQAHNVLEALQRDFASKAPGLKSCLSAIARQLNDTKGANKNKSVLDSVRWFEIKLLHAGKASLGSSVTYFDQFVPQTKLLCDPIYAAHEADAPPRLVYQDASISLLRRCFDTSENVHLSQGMRVGSSVLDDSLLTDKLVTTLVADATANDTELDLPNTTMLADGTAVEGSALCEKTQTPDGTDGADVSPKKVEVEADDCCELCGYRPKGDPKWFRGSMAKHRLTKHSAEVIYKCPFPDCTSQYRNRPDNLRQHQLEKNHFVGDDAATVKAKKPRKHKRQQSQAARAKNDGDVEASTRPAKKRKTAN